MIRVDRYQAEDLVEQVGISIAPESWVAPERGQPLGAVGVLYGYDLQEAK
jgi:hypothetical protein